MICIPAEIPRELCAIDDELKAIYQELKDEFEAKKAGRLDRARSRLAESTQDLKQRNEVRRELDRDLDG